MDVFDLAAKITLDTSEFESGLNKITNLLTGLGIGALMYKATEAVVNFGAAAVKTGMDFDKSMSQVAATMGKTVADMETDIGHASTSFGEFNGNLRDFAQFMGANTAFTATQAADALNYMALAGYNTQQSMDMLPNVLNMAAAGAMDLATASDMVTDTQTAFGITAERTTQMVDEMAKAASTGNTSVSQLGSAFLVVGGLAKELNGGMVTLDDGTEQAVDGIQELEIALTAMANAGIKGGAAGTHMRNMLMKLSSPTSAGTVALQEMGVAIFDTAGNMRSLADIFSDLQGALSKMTQEQRIQTISELFNARDLTSAQAILGAIEQDWDKIGASILQAEGAADQMAKTQLDNLAGDITYLQSAFEGFQISISDVAAPELREFVQFGTQSLSELTDVMNTMSTLSEAGVDVGIAPLLDKVGEQIGEGLELVRDKFMEYAPKLAEALVNVVEFAVKFVPETLSGLIDLIPTFINDLALPILNQAPVLLQAVIELISQLADGIAQQLPTLLPSLSQIVVDLVAVITDSNNLNMLTESAIGLIMAFQEGLLDSIPLILNAIPDLLGGLVEGLSQSFETIVDTLMTEVTPMLEDKYPAIFESLASLIPTISEKVLPILEKLGTEVIPPLVEQWAGLFETEVPKFIALMMPILNAFIMGIVQADTLLAKTLPPIIEALAPLLTVIFQAIAETLPVVLPIIADGLKILIVALSDTLVNEYGPVFGEMVSRIFTAIWNEIVELWDTFVQPIIDKIVEWWDGVKSTGENKLTEIWDGIRNKIREVYASVLEILWPVLDIILPFLDAVQNLFESLGRLVSVIFALIWQTIKDVLEKVWSKIQEVWQAIIDFISPILDNIKAKVEEIWNGIVDFLTPVIDGLKTTIDEAFQFIYDNAVQPLLDLKDKIEEIFNGIKDFILEFVDGALDWGGDMIKNFSQGITENINDLSGAIDTITGKLSANLEHSVPDEGPLSDDDKWMPDMMQSFAKGIRDNTALVDNAIVDAFDFRSMLGGNGTPGGTGLITPTASQPVQVTLVLDKQQLGKVVFDLNNQERQRVGVTLGKEAFA